MYTAGMFLVFASQQMQQVARNWYLYDLTHSPMMLAMLGLANGLPMVLLSLLGGALADRFSKKYMMIISIVGMAASSLFVAIVIVSGAAKGSILGTLLLASVLQAICQAFMLPTRQAIIPELVDRPLLLNAISLNSAFMNLTRIAAPAIGGVLLAVTGVGPVFFIMAGMVFISAGTLLFLPNTPPVVRTVKTSIATDMRATFAYLKKKPVLTNLMVIAFSSVVLGLPFQLLLPIFTTDIMKVGPAGLGTLFSLMGVGALVGALAVASLGSYQRKGALLLLITIGWGLTIILFTAIPHYVVAMFLMIPMGALSTARAALNQTLLQTHLDDNMRARVMGLYMMEVGMQPLGSVPMAALAQVVGVSIAVGSAGAIIATVAVSAWLFRPIIRKLP